MKRSKRILAILVAVVFIAGAQYALAAEKLNYNGPTITLRFSHFAPATHKMVKAVSEPWIKMIEDESNGKIRIKTYNGGILHGAKDGFKACVSDITDFTAAYVMYQAGSFNLMNVLDLPFAFPNAKVASLVSEKLYPKYFKKEYENMGVYCAGMNANGAFNLLTKKPVRNLEDLKGMKIRAGGGVAAKIQKKLGAVPIQITVNEGYNAFQRGMVDGSILYDTGTVSYRFHELGKYLTDIKLYTPVNAWAWNRKTFDNFPPEVKRFMYNMHRRVSAMYGIEYDHQDILSRKIIEDAGIKVIKLPPEEMARWKAAVEPLWEEFIQENEAKGLPARELVNDLRALSKKYSTWTPEQFMKEVTENPVPDMITGM